MFEHQRKTLPNININDYEQSQKLGKGVHGEVYKVIRKSDRKVFAVKSFVPKASFKSETSGISSYTMRELAILNLLQHENIVKYLGFCINKDGIVLVLMEYVPTDLYLYMESQKIVMDDKQIKCIMVDLLKAVAYIHSKGIIHRDIKSNNVLYDPQ